jgi:hypothetical protein
MTEADFQEQVEKLGEAIKLAFTVLVRFLVVFSLMAILALLKVFPALLRAVSVMAWISGIGAALLGAWNLYSHISQDLVGTFLVCATFAAIVAGIPALFDKDDIIWGGMAFAAMVGFGMYALFGALIERTDLYMILGIIPNAIAITGFVAMVTNQKPKEN